MPDLRVLLGQRTAERRASLGLTQAELARRMGLPQPRVSEIERGLVWPHPDRLDALARALECQAGDLLVGGEIDTAP